MSTAVDERTTTLEDLERLLHDVAPCDWSSGHDAFRVPCTEAVTHLAWHGCGSSPKLRVCSASAAWMLAMMHHQCRVRHTCMFCDRPIRECWKVVPI